MATQAMGSISTLKYGTQLRIADTGFAAGCANWTRSNANLDDISSRQNQLLYHLSSDDVASLHLYGHFYIFNELKNVARIFNYNYRVSWIGSSDFSQVLYKMLRVSVCNIKTNVGNFGNIF
jgi:hypothetical protein